MQGLQKKINSFIFTNIGISALFAILGVIFIIYPDASLDVIRWIFAIVLLTSGAYMIAADMGRQRTLPFFSTSFTGIIMVIIGLIFAFHPSVMGIFPILLGAWFIASGIGELRFSPALKGVPGGFFNALSAVISILCGVILIFEPWGGAISMMMFIGIVMLVHAIISIIDMFVLKRNIKDLEKAFKKMIQ